MLGHATHDRMRPGGEDARTQSVFQLVQSADHGSDLIHKDTCVPLGFINQGPLILIILPILF